MTRPHDPHPELTEADRDSQTRFGIRPVPEGHRSAAPYAHRKMRSSRIPPSGLVSPDGQRIWPAPSTTAKAVVWGGVVLGMAGLAAGTAMAVRALSGEDAPAADRRKGGQQAWRHDDPKGLAPRYAGLDEDEREAVRRRVRAQARRDAEANARLRAGAATRRKGGGNFAKDLTETANQLSGGLNNVAQSLVSAFEAFRKVAAQGHGIVGEFVSAADEIRSMLGERPGVRPAPPADPVRHPARPAETPLRADAGSRLAGGPSEPRV